MGEGEGGGRDCTGKRKTGKGRGRAIRHEEMANKPQKAQKREK